MKHLPECHAGNAEPCPVPRYFLGKEPGKHRWSGWPGAYCLKCGAEDPQELCLADDCQCPCHPSAPGPRPRQMGTEGWPELEDHL